MPIATALPPRLPRTALKADERDPALAAGRRILRSAALSADRWPEYRGGNSTEADRRAILDELRLSAAEATRDLTARLVAGDISRPAWHRQMRDLLVPRHYAAALAVAGDGASLGLDAATRRDVEAIIRRQLGFLQRFRDDLGFKRLDGTTEQRAVLNGLAVWSTGQEVARGKAKRDGFRFESNVLGAHDHCEECLAETDRGWVPIGDLSPIGGRICKTRCGCHLAFRRGDGAETKIAGRKRPAARQLEPAAETPKAPAVAARPTRGKHAAELSPGVLPAFVMGDDGEFHEVRKGKRVEPKAKKEPVPKPAKPQPPPPVKVAPDGRGHGKLEDLRDVIESHPRGPGRKAAIVEWINTHRTEAASEVKLHGMAVAEKMYSIKTTGSLSERINLDGITWHFPADVDPSDHPLANTINYMYSSVTHVNIPEELSRHTRGVYFTVQNNKDEAYWGAKYKAAEAFRIAGTGGNGNVVIYGGKDADSGLLAHEMGHNLAFGRYGSVDPPARSAFAEVAAGDEKPPTLYAQNSIAEDFAESVQLYASGGLKAKAPLRHEAIRKLLEVDAASASKRSASGPLPPAFRPTEAKLAVAKGRAMGTKDLDIATASERVIVEAIGGKHTGDSKPIDVEIKRKSGRVDGLEIKTILKKSEPALSVHADALLRKVEYVQADPNRVVHTVVNDQRDAYEGGKYAHMYSGSTLRYKRGSGRYKIDEMHPVGSFAELRRLIDAPDHELPEAARGRLPQTEEELKKLRDAAEKDDAGRKRRDAARRERRKAEKAAAEES